LQELTIAAENAVRDMRADIERRSEACENDQRRMNLLMNEVYRNRFALMEAPGFQESFAAILEPGQMTDYRAFVGDRLKRHREASISLFLANIDNSVYLTDEQRPKMIELLGEIADDKRWQRDNYGNNGLNIFYTLQNGLQRMVAQNDQRLRSVFTGDQLKLLSEGPRNGVVIGSGQFIEIAPSPWGADQ